MFHFFIAVSENPNSEMNFKKTRLIQFPMSESSKNIFLHHMGHIRDDICNSYKKIQPGTNLTSKRFTFGGNNQTTPIMK